MIRSALGLTAPLAFALGEGHEVVVWHGLERRGQSPRTRWQAALWESEASSA